jgi:hypothetical protein
MRTRDDERIAESVWPAVERAIRSRPPLGSGKDAQVTFMKERFTAAVIRHAAMELAEAGIRLPEEC